MTTMLTKALERALPRTTDSRGNPLIVRVCAEGCYLKTKGERWSSAYFLPWGSVYFHAALKRAEEVKLERKKARAQRRAS